MYKDKETNSKNNGLHYTWDEEKYLTKKKMITSIHWDEDQVEMYKDKVILRAKRKHRRMKRKKMKTTKRNCDGVHKAM